MFDWFAEAFDVTLLATIGLIFLVTLVGAYIRASRRDRCLKSFDGFNVTLERSDGKVVWGILEVASTGLELRYRSSVHDETHVESSYILYGQEFGEIQAIYRFSDELDKKYQERRAKDLARSFHPRPLRRILRHIRNFVSVASESLSEVVGLIIGGLRKPAGRYISEASEIHLKSLGSDFIGQVGSGYDPLLEHYIGHKMVFEIMEDEEVHEHVGIFKQYSPDFFEILDVQFPQKHELEIDGKGRLVSQEIDAALGDGTLKVTNNSQQLVMLKSLTDGEEEEELDVILDAGETVELHPTLSGESIRLTFRITRELDIIVPRTRCVVRHRAEFYRNEILPSIIFDLGVKLRGIPKLDAQEQNLRTQLAQNPNSVYAMAKLGGTLMKKGNYAEAEKLLKRALTMRYSLPDNGRRARMLLQEVARKRGLSPLSPGMTAADGRAGQDIAGTAAATQDRDGESSLPLH